MTPPLPGRGMRALFPDMPPPLPCVLLPKLALPGERDGSWRVKIFQALKDQEEPRSAFWIAKFSHTPASGKFYACIDKLVTEGVLERLKCGARWVYQIPWPDEV